MSASSSQLTDLPDATPQQLSTVTDTNGLDSQDPADADAGMDVDTVDNANADGGIDTKSNAGSVASADAQTAASTMDDLSTVESTNEGLSMQEDSKDASKASAPTTNNYKARVQARHDLLRANVPVYDTPQKYTFNSIYSIPQNTVQTNAIALPPCSSHLYTGGTDGYIRRYAWYASLRNYPSERHPILRGYWENLSITAIQARGLLWNINMQTDPSRIRFGPAGISGGTTIPVHSLAVQRDEMYCLAGSAEGVINLYSVRLDEGQLRACLGITGKAHKRNSPVSALALSERDASLLSGGWDKQILQWDLNAGGACVRDFVGHKNPISSILFRPSSSDQGLSDLVWEPSSRSADDSSQAINATSSATSMQQDKTAPELSGRQTSAGGAGDGEADADAEAASPASYDPLFDDDNNASRAASMSRLNSPNSTAMEVTNTTDSAAPSGGLTFPGLNIPSSSGLSLSSLLALGDSKAAEMAKVPTPAKLPVVDVPKIPSFKDASNGDEGVAPVPPPSSDADNTDVFLSCSTDGDCLVWDRRVEKGHVRRLDLPAGCPPWSVSATWSPSGNIVYVGRRNAQVSVYDLRTSTVQAIHLPKSSGRITALHAMLDHRHLLISSNDTVRLWNLEGRNFTIVPSMGSSSTAPALGGAGQAGVSTGAMAQAGNGINGNLASGATGSGGYTNFLVDAREKYLFGSCGSRGWLENGREEIGTFEIDAAR